MLPPHCLFFPTFVVVFKQTICAIQPYLTFKWYALKILPLLLFGYSMAQSSPYDFATSGALGYTQPWSTTAWSGLYPWIDLRVTLGYDDSDSQIPAFDYWSWGLTYRMYFKNWLVWLAELLVSYAQNQKEFDSFRSFHVNIQIISITSL